MKKQEERKAAVSRTRPKAGPRSRQGTIDGMERELKRRKHTEQVARELFDSLNEAVLVYDTSTGRLIDCNERSVEMFGYRSRKEFLAGSLSGLFGDQGPYSWEKIRDRIRQVVKDCPQTFEWLARKKTGETFWIDLNLKSTSIEGNDLILATAWDIGQRKQAEEELKESEAKFKAFMDGLPGFAFIKDDRHRYVFMNRAAEQAFGLRPGEWRGRTIEELIPSAEALAVMANDEKVLSSGTRIQFEEDLTLAGEKRTLLASKFPISRGDGGRMMGAISLDITDHKRADEALRLSEEKLSKTFRESPDWVVVSKVADGTLLEVNDALAESFGCPPEELIGKTTRELGIWLDPKDREDLMAQIERDGRVRNYESRVRYKNGDIGIALWSAERIELEGQKCLIATMRDITVQRATKQELEKSLDRLYAALFGTVQALAMTTEMRDPYTSGHQKRVAGLSEAIAREMGMPEDRMSALMMAASIHDLGKISIPAEILSKPARLSALEYSLIKGHSEVGYGILKDIDFPWPIARIVLEHHERMDGSGYPNGLKGNKLLPESRILMVADVVEAMATHRPYRPALGVDAALAEIEKNKNRFYDPEVVESCETVFRRGYVFN